MTKNQFDNKSKIPKNPVKQKKSQNKTVSELANKDSKALLIAQPAP